MAEKLKVQNGEIQQEDVSINAQVIMSMLNERNMEYEPHVVGKLLELAKDYLANVLNEAKYFSNHAGRNTIDVNDVRLSTNLPPDVDLDMDLDSDSDNEACTSKGLKCKHQKMDYF